MVPRSPVTRYLLVSHPATEVVGKSVTATEVLLWKGENGKHSVITGLLDFTALGVEECSWVAHLAASLFLSLGAISLSIVLCGDT